MLKYIIVVLISFLAIGGCGGGGNDGECDFDFDSFLNGPDAATATTVWSCVGDLSGEFAFQAFEDGTAFSSDLGPITYQQTGCRRAAFQSGSGNGEIINLEGSITSGILTYEQISNNPDLDIGPVGCVWVDL